MTAVASSAAGSMTSSGAETAPSFAASLSSLGALPFSVGDHTSPAAFFNLPPPASFFASLFASSVQNAVANNNSNNNQTQPTPPQPTTPAAAVQQPSLMVSPHHQQSQQTPPRSSIGSPPPGIYCDLGPAVFERTSRGYTVLRFEGYSFSKISDNRTKTYWRCANRTCRAKVHTNGGRIVYVGREPHDHKPRLAGSQNAPKIRRPKPAFTLPTITSMNSMIGHQTSPESFPLDLRPKKESSLVDEKIECENEELLLKIEDDDEDISVVKSRSSLVVKQQNNEEDHHHHERPQSSSPTPSSDSDTSSPASPTANNNSHAKRLVKKKSKMLSLPAVRQLPRTSSEVELFRLLQRANLLCYYDVFVSRGGDDVQQLVEANEDEFAEILRLVDMTSKPLHVRRLQKVLSEWVTNPAQFRAPFTAAEIALLSGADKVLSSRMPTTPSSILAPTTAASGSKSTGSSSTAVSPRNSVGGGDAACLSVDHLNGNITAPINLCIVSHSAYPTATSSSSSGSPMTHNSLSRASPSVFFNPNPNGGSARLNEAQASKSSQSSSSVRQSATAVDDHSSTDGSSGNGDFNDNTDSDASSFCTNLSVDSAAAIGAENGAAAGLLMLNHSASKVPVTLTPEMSNQIIQKAAEMVAKYPDLLELNARTDLSTSRLKAHEIQQLLAVVTMPREHPNYLELVQRFSMIYGRFDNRRKNPERRLSFHELAVNDASAALSLLIPALLTHRERLYQLARQTVREAGINMTNSPVPNLNRNFSPRPGSVSPAPATFSAMNNNRLQSNTFVTPTPPAAHSGKVSFEASKRSLVVSDADAVEPPNKTVRRSVITESGEIVFPGDEAVASSEDLTTSETTTNASTVAAMALAQQLGFSELAVELQKDHEDSSNKKTSISGDDQTASE